MRVRAFTLTEAELLDAVMQYVSPHIDTQPSKNWTIIQQDDGYFDVLIPEGKD